MADTQVLFLGLYRFATFLILFITMVRRRLVTLVMRGAAPPLLSIINNRLLAKKL